MSELTQEQQNKADKIAKIHYRQFNIIGKGESRKNNSSKSSFGDIPVFLLKDFNFTNGKYERKNDLTTTDYRETVPKLVQNLSKTDPKLIQNLSKTDPTLVQHLFKTQPNLLVYYFEGFVYF